MEVEKPCQIRLEQKFPLIPVEIFEIDSIKVNKAWVQHKALKK